MLKTSKIFYTFRVERLVEGERFIEGHLMEVIFHFTYMLNFVLTLFILSR